VDRASLLDKIRTDLAHWILQWEQGPEDRHYMSIDPGHVVSVSEYLFNERQGRFAIASGVDTPQGIEILYHFCFDLQGCVVSVRALTDRHAPQIDSISSVIPGAAWIEREIHDILGVEFLGHPNLKRLILADDWPEGVYPLRRDYKP